MKRFLFFVANILLVLGCSGVKIVNYQNWDSNQDRFLNNIEFMRGYMESGYFNTWSQRKAFINADQLYQGIFKSIDADKDKKLSSGEFHSKIDFFYLRSFTGDFKSWDQDSSGFLEGKEFFQHIRKSAIVRSWDSSADGKITAREFAKQMFAIADIDENGLVDTLEFNVWYANR